MDDDLKEIYARIKEMMHTLGVTEEDLRWYYEITKAHGFDRLDCNVPPCCHKPTLLVRFSTAQVFLAAKVDGASSVNDHYVFWHCDCGRTCVGFEESFEIAVTNGTYCQHLDALAATLAKVPGGEGGLDGVAGQLMEMGLVDGGSGNLTPLGQSFLVSINIIRGDIRKREF